MPSTTTTTTRTTVIKRSGQPPQARSSLWSALVVLSLVSMLSVVERRNRGFEEKWSIALTAISFSLAILVCLGHLFIRNKDEMFSKMEGIIIMIIISAWIFALPVIMAPEQRLAVNGTSIIDANLYFGSWGALLVALIIFTQFGTTIFQIKWWLVLFCSSLIAMIASIRAFINQYNCPNDNDLLNYTGSTEICNELRVAMALTVISSLISIVMTICFYFFNFRMHGGIGILAGSIVLIIWGVLVTILTFGNGPGSNVGNLFFATWVSLFLSLCLFVWHVQDIRNTGDNNGTPSTTTTTTTTTRK